MAGACMSVYAGYHANIAPSAIGNVLLLILFRWLLIRVQKVSSVIQKFNYDVLMQMDNHMRLLIMISMLTVIRFSLEGYTCRLKSNKPSYLGVAQILASHVILKILPIKSLQWASLAPYTAGKLSQKIMAHMRSACRPRQLKMPRHSLY